MPKFSFNSVLVTTVLVVHRALLVRCCYKVELLRTALAERCGALHEGYRVSNASVYFLSSDI